MTESGRKQMLPNPCLKYSSRLSEYRYNGRLYSLCVVQPAQAFEIVRCSGRHTGIRRKGAIYLPCFCPEGVATCAHPGGGAMRNGVPYGVKFISRFFLEIVPPVLAAVIGGFLFGHYYTGSSGSEQGAIAAVSAIPADGRAALVDEEHAQLVDFLKHGREAAKPGDAATGPAAPAKPRSAAAKESVVKVRRAPVS